MSTAAYPPVPTDPIFRLSVDQYHDMIRSGILTPDDQDEMLPVSIGGQEIGRIAVRDILP
ncbi:MAG TPA: hypothetical protein VFC46_15785 [Humisphaera sp.]|nr:hypothetical protein [Humisphaera sp.]